MRIKISIFALMLLTMSACTTKNLLTRKKNVEVFNRDLKVIKEEDKIVFELSEREGPGIAWFNNLEFTEGTIEFDAKGRDVPQKSFIGIAFHGIDNSTYEAVYFRPFNFQTSDSIRHIHAIQYSFEPKFNFQQLRDTRKDEFESAIKPADIQPTDWFHVKLNVTGNVVRVFLNGHSEPALEVSTLNPKPVGKKIGYWVGNNSNGDFANFKISGAIR